MSLSPNRNPASVSGTAGGTETPYGFGRDTLCSRGLRPLTWLVYVGFWIIQPYYDQQRTEWTQLGSAFAVFLLCFCGGLYGSLPVRRLSVLGMLALALMYVPVNESSFGIYFYIPWFLLNVVEGDRTYSALIALECLVILLQAHFHHLHAWEWAVSVSVCALSGTNAVRLRQQARANAKLRMAQSEIEQLAKTAERERIARDLHDVLGHTLSLIAVKSELAGRLLATDPAKTARELAEIQTTARRALSEVRQTVSGYRAQGMEAELQQAAAALLAAGIAVTSRPGRPPRLAPQQEASLALVLREGVTNIVRHSGARSCSFTLESGADETVLELRDDGCGFPGAEGNGLRGMRGRVRELGGRMELRSDQGAVLRVVLPVVPSLNDAESMLSAEPVAFSRT